MSSRRINYCMVNIKNRVTSRIPERSTRSAKFAAIGAGTGALFSRKLAIVLAGVGAYLGSRMAKQSYIVDEEIVESEVEETED